MVLALALVLMLLGWWATAAKAQAPANQAVIRGVVVDEFGEPAAVIRVTATDLDTTRPSVLVMTNLEGEFYLPLPPGDWILRVQAYGYQEFRDTLRLPNAAAFAAVAAYQIQLQPLESMLQEVVITGKFNPAIPVIKNAIKHRSDNRMRDLDAYEHKAYTKVTLTLNNITLDKLERQPLKPMRDFIRAHQEDSVLRDSSGRFNAVIYISESVSRIYHKKPHRKEVVQGVQTAGFEIPQSELLTSSMATQISVYDNSMDVLGRQFVSPIASTALLSYNYELVNYQSEGLDTLYIIKLYPKSASSPTWQGMVYIENRSWAVTRVDLTLNERPNLNFVEGIRVRQEFQPIDGQWVMSLNDILLDFENNADKVGMIGRTVTVMTEYVLHQTQADGFYRNEDLEIKDDAKLKDSTFWNRERTTALEADEMMGFELIENVKMKGIWQIYNFIIEVTTAGKFVAGPVAFGLYSNLVSYNPVEGLRVSLGLYTTEKFSTRTRFFIRGAYGFGDERWKISSQLRYMLLKRPRLELDLRYADEIEQTGYRNYDVAGNRLLVSLLMRVPLFQMNYYRQYYGSLYMDVARGVAARSFLRIKSLSPAFDLSFVESNTNQRFRDYSITEVGLHLRFGIREKYIIKNNEKVYLGTKWPKIFTQYNQGLQGPFGGQYRYHHAELTLSNWVGLGRLGYSSYTLSLGQIWGALPLPSLWVFPGNQSLGFDPMSFGANIMGSILGDRNRSDTYDPVTYNLMYFYEFVADRYLQFGVEHHFEGFFLDRISLNRFLRWKEVLTFRLAYGSLSSANLALNAGNTEVSVQAPSRTPYMELGFGIENILKVARIDFIWRLSYRNPEPPPRLQGYRYNFGMRFSFGFAL